jgi:very-short-patch-repair endonuclease
LGRRQRTWVKRRLCFRLQASRFVRLAPRSEAAGVTPPKLGGVAAPNGVRKQRGRFLSRNLECFPRAMKRRQLIHNIRSKKAQRRELRNNRTPAEAALWKHLSNSQLAGKKFCRQHSIGPFIVDFYWPECRLIVELDGAPHLTEEGLEKDRKRTEFLKRFNVKVIRFENWQVFENAEWVLDVIERHLRGPA